MNKTSRNLLNVPVSMPKGQVIGKFIEYSEATTFVETLINHGFPAGSIAIVGKDLRSVERIRGKMSYGKLALGGAITGSWLGLIIGLLVGSSPDTTANLELGSTFSSIMIGAGIGILINILRFSLVKNKRAFISQSMVIASKYEVQVPANLVAQAETAVSEHQTHA